MEARQAYMIGANDQILSSADYGPVIIAYRNGAPVRLPDVADVIDGAENVKQAAWMNDAAGRHCQHAAAARRQHHQVVDRIKALLPQLQGLAAASVEVAVLTDRTDHHPRLGRGRAVRADADHRAGRHGDVPLPAQPCRRR